MNWLLIGCPGNRYSNGTERFGTKVAKQPILLLPRLVIRLKLKHDPTRPDARRARTNGGLVEIRPDMDLSGLSFLRIIPALWTVREGFPRLRRPNKYSWRVSWEKVIAEPVAARSTQDLLARAALRTRPRASQSPRPSRQPSRLLRRPSPLPGLPPVAPPSRSPQSDRQARSIPWPMGSSTDCMSALARTAAW
jgi:hypothetical protein